MKRILMFVIVAITAINWLSQQAFTIDVYADSGITRLQAIKILTKNLDLDDVLKAHTYVHPFNDVAESDDALVGFLYENKIIFGTETETFSPNAPCTLKMLTVMILRELDYNELYGDFIYESVLKNENSGNLELSALRKYLHETIIQGQTDAENIILTEEQAIEIVLYSNITRLKSDREKLMDKFKNE